MKSLIRYECVRWMLWGAHGKDKQTEHAMNTLKIRYYCEAEYKIWRNALFFPFCIYWYMQKTGHRHRQKSIACISFICSVTPPVDCKIYVDRTRSSFDKWFLAEHVHVALVNMSPSDGNVASIAPGLAAVSEREKFTWLFSSYSISPDIP